MQKTIIRTSVLFILTCLAIVTVAAFSMPLNTDATIVEHAVKTTDQTVTGDTLTNDTALALPLQKNKTYIIDGALFVRQSNQGAACSFAFIIPAGATMRLGVLVNSSNGQASLVLQESGVSQSPSCNEDVPSQNPNVVEVIGTIEMGSTDGDLQLQTATYPDETITVELGSFLRADKL